MKQFYALILAVLGLSAAATNHQVQVSSNVFSPAVLSISVGDTVTWTQVSGTHNVNGSTATFASNPASFGSGAPAGGTWTYSYVFTTAGTYAYQCDPHAAMMIGSITVTAPCADLFFSEYLEGSSNNKALEIYNPTNAPINLSTYSVKAYNNGGTTVTNFLNLPNKTIGAHDVYVIAHPSAIATILGIADTTSSVTNFNGDDAIVLFKGTDTLDIIGKVGFDPGSSWTVGTGSTADFTLVRQAAINQGQLNWSIGATEWDVYPQNTITNLGTHSSSCQPVITATIGFLQSTIHVSEASDTNHIKLYVSNNQNPTDSIALLISTGGGFIINTDATFSPSFNSNGSVTLPITTSSDTLTVSFYMINDTILEYNESFSLTISQVGTITPAANDSLFVKIIDDEIPTYIIPDVKGLDANFKPDSLGVMCKLVGTVLGVNTQSFATTGNVAFTIHDGTVGFGVFGNGNLNLGYTVNEGDVVRVIGTIDQFNGLAQINVDSIVVTGSNASLPNPTIITSLDESTESQLIRMNGVTVIDPTKWTNSGPGFNVDVTNGTDTIQLRIDADVSDVYNAPCPVGTFDIIGIGGQFDSSPPHNSGYQMLPRYLADFIYPVPVTYDLAITEVMANSNDSNTAVNGDWFEVTNYGSTAVDLAGFSWDDNSWNAGTVVFPSVTVAPGEAIVVAQIDAANEAAFRSTWNLGPWVQVLVNEDFTTAQPAFSANGDGVALFDTSATPIEICRAEYTAALAGFSAEFDTTCTYLGNASVGVRGAYSSTGGDVGSPGNQSVGLEERGLRITLQPNPTTGVVTVTLPFEGTFAISIQNINGQTLAVQSVNASSAQLDLRGLARGMYLVVVSSEAGQSTQRIVLQ